MLCHQDYIMIIGWGSYSSKLLSHIFCTCHCHGDLSCEGWQLGVITSKSFPGMTYVVARR